MKESAFRPDLRVIVWMSLVLHDFLCLPCIARFALITCVACVAWAGSLSLRHGQTICLVSHVVSFHVCHHRAMPWFIHVLRS